jgi:hypothetical protein
MLPESIFTLNGWCTREKADFLYNLVLKSESALTVELGVFAGRSLIPMALAHKALNKGVIYGIDPWEKSASTQNYPAEDANYQWWNTLNHDAIYTCFLKSLKDYDIEDITKVIKSKSKDSVDIFAPESIYILHQDGNHSEETSCNEIALYADKIRKEGYWIMDDTDWETTKKAQEFILTKGFIEVYDAKAWKVYQKTIAHLYPKSPQDETETC